jgi:hypothetical protein
LACPSSAGPWLILDYGSSWDKVGALLPLAYEHRASRGSLLTVLWVGEGGASLPSLKGLGDSSSVLLLSWIDRSLRESGEGPLMAIL